jgi:hypothetical protein
MIGVAADGTCPVCGSDKGEKLEKAHVMGTVKKSIDTSVAT